MKKQNEHSSPHAPSLTLAASDFSIATMQPTGLPMPIENGFVNNLFNPIEKSAQIFHTGLKRPRNKSFVQSVAIEQLSRRLLNIGNILVIYQLR